VRKVTNIARKRADAEANPPGNRDPFGQPEPELFVADLCPSHFALLNKFNVLDPHLLAVTHDFVDQETLLGEGDFAALVECMREADVLAFYNGGHDAGASQEHRHLQVVALPLLPGLAQLPMETCMHGDRLDAPFPHAFARLGSDDTRDAAKLLRRYREMLSAAGIASVRREGVERQSAPYNLLVTHAWMLVVPRTRADFEGIDVNGLAFAGSLFVRDEAQLETVRRLGPWAILRGVTLPS